jgi:hypothetical protein
MIRGVLRLCRQKLQELPLALGRHAAEYCELYEGNY